MKDMMIGVDPAKAIFQVHGAQRTGEVQFRKKHRLGQRTITEGSWLARRLARKPKRLVAIALANIPFKHASMCCRAMDGPAGLGDADEKRRLRGSGAGRRGMMLMSNR